MSYTSTFFLISKYVNGSQLQSTDAWTSMDGAESWARWLLSTQPDIQSVDVMANSMELGSVHTNRVTTIKREVAPCS